MTLALYRLLLGIRRLEAPDDRLLSIDSTGRDSVALFAVFARGYKSGFHPNVDLRYPI